MRENNYLKGKSKQMMTGEFSDCETSMLEETSKFSKKRFIVGLSLFLFIAFSVVMLVLQNNVKQVAIVDTTQIQPMTTSLAATAVQRTVLTIPSGTVKANPFLPYRDLGNGDDYAISENDLVAPPVSAQNNSEAARVMRTVVSGILYDKFSPSAILNIEGSDYLVKKGDVINNYHVINIAKDFVTVQLGENVYKAGIGELLTEGVINHNDVSNLNNKFGGENNGLQ